MGLAPYASKSPPPAAGDLPPPPRLTSGSLLLGGKSGGGTGEDAFHVDWEAIESLPRPNGLGQEGGQDEGDDGSGDDDGLRGLGAFYAALASRAQEGLEEAALEFIKGLRDRTGEENVCLCGGVALNSVLNGKIAREVGRYAGVFVCVRVCMGKVSGCWRVRSCVCLSIVNYLVTAVIFCCCGCRCCGFGSCCRGGCRWCWCPLHVNSHGYISATVAAAAARYTRCHRHHHHHHHNGPGRPAFAVFLSLRARATRGLRSAARPSAGTSAGCFSHQAETPPYPLPTRRRATVPLSPRKKA